MTSYSKSRSPHECFDGSAHRRGYDGPHFLEIRPESGVRAHHTDNIRSCAAMHRILYDMVTSLGSCGPQDFQNFEYLRRDPDHRLGLETMQIMMPGTHHGDEVPGPQNVTRHPLRLNIIMSLIPSAYLLSELPPKTLCTVNISPEKGPRPLPGTQTNTVLSYLHPSRDLDV